jgi:hypothetical protein
MGNLCKALQVDDPYSYYSPLFPERGDFVKFLRNRDYIQYRNLAESRPFPGPSPRTFADIILSPALAQV